MTYEVKIKARHSLLDPHGIMFMLKTNLYEDICNIAGAADKGFWIDREEYDIHHAQGHAYKDCEKCGNYPERWGWYMPWFGNSKLDREYVVFLFEDPEVATLVKLTYGGI